MGDEPWFTHGDDPTAQAIGNGTGKKGGITIHGDIDIGGMTLHQQIANRAAHHIRLRRSGKVFQKGAG
jgi:hypothetical protein